MSGKIYYRKLIRDRIPERIAVQGSECETRILDDSEFKEALRRKVAEEASALPQCATKEELVSELADILAVLDEIRKQEGVTDNEVEAALAKNFAKKGGFDARLFLEWSSDDGYKSNEQA